MSAVYRYQFCDLLTDRPIAELDLSGVSFDRRIGQPGSFSASFPVTNPEAAELAAKVAGRYDGRLRRGPGRTLVHVWRGSEIWGSYIIWSAEPSCDERGRISLSLDGASLESYLYHREIREDLEFRNADQLDIARGLVAHMERERPIGLEVSGPEISGVYRTRRYRSSEAATYGERLEELAEVVDGPEWMIRTRPERDRRVREFVVDLRMGQDITEHVFAQPGNVLSWSYPADAGDTATSWRARGDTPNDDLSEESEPSLSDTWEDPAYRKAGWPLLERTVDYQGVTDTDVLDDYARWRASRTLGASRFPQVTVRLGENTSFSPANLGDRARLTLVNDWFPLVRGRPSFSKSWRVIGIEVTPVSRDDGQETATLIFQEETEADPERFESEDSGATAVLSPMHPEAA